MFSNVMIGLFLSFGIAAWVFRQIHRRTGGNTQSSLVVGALVGLLTFIFAVLVLGLLF